MTNHATDAAHAAPSAGGAAMLPAIASIILALLWGGYTALVLFEIFSTPLPQI